MKPPILSIPGCPGHVIDAEAKIFDGQERQKQVRDGVVVIESVFSGKEKEIPFEAIIASVGSGFPVGPLLMSARRSIMKCQKIGEKYDFLREKGFSDFEIAHIVGEEPKTQRFPETIGASPVASRLLEIEEEFPAFIAEFRRTDDPRLARRLASVIIILAAERKRIRDWLEGGEGEAVVERESVDIQLLEDEIESLKNQVKELEDEKVDLLESFAEMRAERDELKKRLRWARKGNNFLLHAFQRYRIESDLQKMKEYGVGKEVFKPLTKEFSGEDEDVPVTPWKFTENRGH